MFKTAPDKDIILPPLPLEEWKQTKNTLHLFLQIIGKIRLSLFPPLNHWWHAALYVSSRGITTRAIPYGSGSFEIEFDLIEHKVIIKTIEEEREFPVYNGLTVSEFYRNIFHNLSGLGILTGIKAVPYDCFSKEPFETDNEHSAYDKKYIDRFCRILISVSGVFEEFRGRFRGKSTPVHLFWHSFDLALTRFSGRPAPVREGAGKVEREAYSHEVISFGFWAGDDNIPEPAFYSYTHPEPEGLTNEPLDPKAAFWGSIRGGAIGLLMYDEVRKSGAPDKVILDFLESAYRAGVKRGNWEKEKM